MHTAYGVALAAHGRAEEALPALEKGVFLRRLWAQTLDLIDGLIALAASPSRRPRARGRSCSTRRRTLGRTVPRPGRAPGAARGREARGPAHRAPRAGEELSERELTVLRQLGSGRSEREIAAELYLSFNTVHSHVKSIYRKLGASSRAEAVARAREAADHLGDTALGEDSAPARRESAPRCDTIVLVHGFWVTPRSWEHWVAHYEAGASRSSRPPIPGSRSRSRRSTPTPRRSRR